MDSLGQHPAKRGTEEVVGCYGNYSTGKLTKKRRKKRINPLHLLNIRFEESKHVPPGNIPPNANTRTRVIFSDDELSYPFRARIRIPM